MQQTGIWSNLHISLMSIRSAGCRYSSRIRCKFLEQRRSLYQLCLWDHHLHVSLMFPFLWFGIPSLCLGPRFRCLQCLNMPEVKGLLKTVLKFLTSKGLVCKSFPLCSPRPSIPAEEAEERYECWMKCVDRTHLLSDLDKPNRSRRPSPTLTPIYTPPQTPVRVYLSLRA
jgi:hypothetical protein